MLVVTEEMGKSRHIAEEINNDRHISYSYRNENVECYVNCVRYHNLRKP